MSDAAAAGRRDLRRADRKEAMTKSGLGDFIWIGAG